MSEGLLTALIVGPATLVVIGFFLVLWNARRTPVQTLTAVISGIVLLVWAVGAALLAQRGFFRPPDATSAPPVGKFILAALGGMALCLVASGSLRGLLSNQRHLIWLNVWRLVGIVFLLLMAAGQMPALWALPAGIGDVIVGAAAPWVAMKLGEAGRYLQSVWAGRSRRRGRTRHHDEHRAAPTFPYRAVVGAGHEFPPGSRTDLPGAAGFHAAHRLAMAIVARHVGSQTGVFCAGKFVLGDTID
jgi:predicted membrane protein